MQKRDAAAFLAGVSQVEGSQASAPTNLHVISGEVGTRSEDGKATVAIDGLVFSEADDQYVEMDTLGGLEEGDIATVILTGEDGHAMTPLAIGAPGSVDTIRDTAEAAYNKSNVAQELAQEAKDVADAVGQHFWTDENGVHVTEVTEEEWSDTPDGSNILINSLGILLRNAATVLAQFTSQAVVFYDGAGNEASNVFARFGRDGSQIGYDSESHLEMDYHSMSLVDNEGSTYFDVRDLRDAEGYIHYVGATFTGDGTKTRFELDDGVGPLPQTVDELESVTVDGVEVEYTLPYPDSTPIDTVDISPAPASGSAVIVYVKKLRDNTYKAYTLGTRSGETGTRSYAMGTGVEASRDNSYALGKYNRTPNDGYFYYGDYLSFGNGTSDTDRSNLMDIGVMDDGYDCINWYGNFINIVRQDTSEAVFNTVRRDTGKVARFGIGAGGQNRGIWIGSLSSDFDTREDLRDDPEYYPGIPTRADGGWMIYADYYDNVHISGYGTDVQTETTSSSTTSGSTISVPSGSDRSIVRITIQGSGCYILIGHASFASNTSGRRVIGITSSDNGSLTSTATSPIISQPPVSGAATSMTVVDVVTLPWPSAGNEEPELTRYLTVYQNSGGNLAAGGSIKAVRVSMPS